MQEPELIITPEILRLIAELNEFKGKLAAFKNLSPDRLTMLRKIATIESVASSTRIEGVTLSNQAVEALLSNLRHQSFSSFPRWSVGTRNEEVKISKKVVKLI